MIQTPKSNMGGQNIGYIICESGTEPMQPKIIAEPKEEYGIKRGIIIETNLQDADVVNRNKNIYEKAALEDGLNSEYVRERIATRSWYGEASHPLNPDIKRQLYLDQSRMSHRVNKTRWNGNILVGEVESANTATGNDFKGCIQQGCQVAFSLRAVGPITQKRRDGVVVVKPPLLMFAYDWIIHPSHRVAYMTSVLQETADLVGQLDKENKGVFKMISEAEILNFIGTQSKRVQTASESLEMKLSNMTLLEDLRTVCFSSDIEGTKACIYLEDSIAYEINTYMSSLKNKFM